MHRLKRRRRIAQIVIQILRVIIPLRHVFLGRASNDTPKRRTRQRMRNLDRRIQLHPQHFARILRVENKTPRKHFDQNQPNRINIGPRPQRLVQNLLRRHVLRRPNQHVLAIFIRLAQNRRHAKIYQLHDVFARANAREHDVFGLQIAVNYPLIMRLDERIDDLHRYLANRRTIKRPALDDHIAQLTPIDELHHDARHALFQYVVVEKPNDIRVVELLNRRQFVHKPRQNLVIRVDELYRNISVELEKSRAIDASKRAFANKRRYFVFSKKKCTFFWSIIHEFSKSRILFANSQTLLNPVRHPSVLGLGALRGCPP